MVTTKHMTRCQGIGKPERHVVAMHSDFYNLLPFKKRYFCFGMRFGHVKKQ